MYNIIQYKYFHGGLENITNIIIVYPNLFQVAFCNHYKKHDLGSKKQMLISLGHIPRGRVITFVN